MRVTIKGLTDSTITFNTLGIILRGNSAKPELYPNSIARHIDIKTDEQMRELVGLKNAKLVEVIDESEQKVTVSTKDIATPTNPEPKKDLPPELTRPEPQVTTTTTITTDESVETEEIEDMPPKLIQPDAPQPEEPEEEEVLTIASKKVEEPKKKVGRPKKKSAKNKKSTKVKSVKRSKNLDVAEEPKETEDAEEDSKIVVMTPNGPITGKAANNMAGDMPESEATRASIEALKQMEEEEAQPESLIDESKLDASEQMGGTVVIATGDSNMAKVEMKNSILPEADAIKERGIKFIDPNGDDSPVDDSSLDESIKDIFIDSDDYPEDEGDDFIEC